MDLEIGEVIGRWPFLAQLGELPGPPWRFGVTASNVLAGERAYETYVETLWIVDEAMVGLNRTPIPGRTGQTVARLDFVGPLTEAVALLQQPVRWEEDR